MGLLRLRSRKAIDESSRTGPPARVHARSSRRVAGGGRATGGPNVGCGSSKSRRVVSTRQTRPLLPYHRLCSRSSRRGAVTMTSSLTSRTRNLRRLLPDTGATRQRFWRPSCLLLGEEAARPTTVHLSPGVVGRGRPVALLILCPPVPVTRPDFPGRARMQERRRHDHDARGRPSSVA